MSDIVVHSFCPEHGINCKIDDDGTCSSCGASAVGPALDTIERQRAVIEAAEEVSEWAMDSAVPGQFTPEPVTKLWNALRALDGGGDG